jgi:hypothetical protein
MAPEVQDPKKLLKIVNYQNCQKHVLGQLEKVGGHRYPPGSDSNMTQYMNLQKVRQETNGFSNPGSMMKGVSCSRATVIATNTNTETHFFPKFSPTIFGEYLFIFTQS